MWPDRTPRYIRESLRERIARQIAEAAEKRKLAALGPKKARWA